MLRKCFAFITIPLIFAIFVSRSSGNFRHGSEPIQDCAENSSYFGYCEDCDSQVECKNGVFVSRTTCSDNEECVISNLYSACSYISEDTECSCPETGTVRKPDPYDNRKYLQCTDGDRTVYSCPYPLIYIPEFNSCKENICYGNEYINVAYNCTCYVSCLDEEPSSATCCRGGQIFDEETLSCVAFEIFTCEGKSDGRYVDNHNCSIFYTCQNGVIFDTGFCPDGQNFSVADGICEEGACEEDIIFDCGICRDNQTFIPIDCYHYYECVTNPENWGQPYIPIEGGCPIGTCFDVRTANCELND